MTTDEEWLRAAYGVAGWSPDPSTQNGGILINADGIEIARCCNEFPLDVKYTPARWERPLKYSLIEHAERNLIYSAARRGLSTCDSTMFVPWAACADCARAIIQAGVVRLVRHHDATVHGAGGNWDGSISIADAMLNEAGVEITDVVGRLMPNEFFIWHNGEYWSP